MPMYVPKECLSFSLSVSVCLPVCVSPNLKSVLEDLKSSLLKIGLEICDRKCELYCPSGECCNFPTPVACDRAIILGTPIGNSDFIPFPFIDIAKFGDCLCSELVKSNDSQSKLNVDLRHCCVPQLNYLARQIFPV